MPLPVIISSQCCFAHGLGQVHQLQLLLLTVNICLTFWESTLSLADVISFYFCESQALHLTSDAPSKR